MSNRTLQLNTPDESSGSSALTSTSLSSSLQSSIPTLSRNIKGPLRRSSTGPVQPQPPPPPKKQQDPPSPSRVRRGSSSGSPSRTSLISKPERVPGPSPSAGSGETAPPETTSPRLIRRQSIRFPVKASTDNSTAPDIIPLIPKPRSRSNSVNKEKSSKNNSARTASPPVSKRRSLSRSPPTDVEFPRPESPEEPPSHSASSSSSIAPSDHLVSEQALFRPLVAEPVDSTLPDKQSLRTRAISPSMSAASNTSTSQQKATMSSTDNSPAYNPQSDRSATSRVGMQPGLPVPMPNLSGQANGVIGNLLKGPVGPDGRLKDAALMVGIKLDLEAEVHLTARVRGDILVGLY